MGRMKEEFMQQQFMQQEELNNQLNNNQMTKKTMPLTNIYSLYTHSEHPNQFVIRTSQKDICRIGTIRI